MKASAQATATDFDFEEDLLDDEMALVDEASRGEQEIEYTGFRKLTMAEEAAKYGILVGIFGGGVAWSYWEGKKEDREEEARVKAEVAIILFSHAWSCQCAAVTVECTVRRKQSTELLRARASSCM